MQLLVNATYAIPIGIGLWLIGIPNPILWGMLCGLLRFVPYIGPFVAAFFPLALAMAVDPGWMTFLLARGMVHRRRDRSATTSSSHGSMARAPACRR